MYSHTTEFLLSLIFLIRVSDSIKFNMMLNWKCTKKKYPYLIPIGKSFLKQKCMQEENSRLSIFCHQLQFCGDHFFMVWLSCVRNWAAGLVSMPAGYPLIVLEKPTLPLKLWDRTLWNGKCLAQLCVKNSFFILNCPYNKKLSSHYTLFPICQNDGYVCYDLRPSSKTADYLNEMCGSWSSKEDNFSFHIKHMWSKSDTLWQEQGINFSKLPSFFSFVPTILLFVGKYRLIQASSISLQNWGKHREFTQLQRCEIAHRVQEALATSDYNLNYH